MSTLSLSNRCPVSDMGQILEGYTSTGVQGLRHNPLGDDMIGIGSEPVLSSGEPLQVLLRASGTFSLKVLSQVSVHVADLVNGPAAMLFTITIDSDFNDTEVDAESARRLDFLGLWNIDNGTEVEYIFDENEVRLTADSVQPALMIIADDDWYLDSTVERQNGDRIQPPPAEDSLVVDHSTVGLEGGFDRFVDLVSFAHFSDGTDCHLCGETELFSDVLVDEGLQLDFSSGPELEGLVRDTVASSVEPLHGVLESDVLLIGSTELDFKGQIHNASLNIEYSSQCIYTYRQFLPGLKPWASLAMIW